jgi:peptidoglycan/LPS O-acetylase OafA/YrhL
MRAIAVVSVVVDHLGITLLPHSTRYGLALLGRFGVLLFFVHTSLVLMGSIERQGRAPRWPIAFYVRRVFRIYPLLWVTIAIAVAFHVPDVIPEPTTVQHYTPPSLAIIVSNVLLIQDFWTQTMLQSPFWSLPLEVLMYVVLPLCFLAAQRSWRWMVGSMMVLLAGYLMVAHTNVPGAWHFRVFRFGPCFMAGVIAYHLLRRGTRARWSPWVLIGTLTIALATMFFEVPFLDTLDAIALRNWIPCLIVGSVLPFIREARPSRFAEVTKTICTYSYGIYVLHLPVMWLVFGRLHGLPVTVQVPLFVAILGVVCFVAYWLIEKPCTDLGKRVTARWSARREASIEQAPIAQAA